MSAWGNDGGFMEGVAEGAGFMNSSQITTPDAGRKERRSQNIVPVTIKMINDAPGEAVLIGDTEVSMLTIVGIIRFVDVSSTKITYTVDDTTGIIEGVKWIESEVSDEQQRPLMEMTYCRISGSVRTQMGKKHVLILNIVPITDINRITTHLLEVILGPMKLQSIQTQRASGAVGPSGQAQTPGGGNQTPNLKSSNVGAVGGNSFGLSGPSSMVYEMVKMAKEGSGIYKYDLYEMLKGKITPANVDKILEDLSNEGHLFSSIDDDHFKCAENF